MAKRTKAWLKWIALAVVVLIVAGGLALTFLLGRWTAKPPPLPADTAIMGLTRESRDGKTWLGKSWAGRRDGLLVVHRDTGGACRGKTIFRYDQIGTTQCPC